MNISIIDVQKYLKEKDVNKECTLLSTEFEGYRFPLLFRCNICGEEFTRTYANVRKERFRCANCGRARRTIDGVGQAPANKLTLQDVKDYLKENDIEHQCELLSTEYINNQSPLLFKCNICGNNFQRSFAKVKMKRFRCPDCGIKAGAKKLKYTAEDVEKDILEKRGYIMIGPYVNSHTGVLCKCEKGHEFELFYSEFLSNGRGCKECAIIAHSGVNHPNYQNGGHQEVVEYFRSAIKPWKKKILEKSCFTCDISKKQGGNLIIHHLKSFSSLLKEAHLNAGIEFRKMVSEYQPEEIETISKELLSLHTEDIGVVINQEYHKKFHSIYGLFNFTPENYLEFKEKIQKELIE